MGLVREPVLVKPICGVMFFTGLDLSSIIHDLESALGRVEDQSPIFPFSFTAYYRVEMGSDLQKVIFSFSDLILPNHLIELKHQANIIESRWSFDGKRRINLDPGYIAGGKLVLASTKDFSHRIYLDRGIYGDVQLRFIRGKFVVSEWTYPDYQTELAFSFFQKVRKKYIYQEKEYDKKHAV